MAEDYISLADAEKIIDVSHVTLWRWCKSGKIACREIEDKASPGGKKYEVSKVAAMKKQLEKSGKANVVGEIEERSKEKSKNDKPDEEYIDNVIQSLNLPIAESKRLRATLKCFTKADAERILKTEQALSKQKDNVLRDGSYIEKTKVKEQVEFVFSSFARETRDLIYVWQKRFFLSDIDTNEMGLEYDGAMKRAMESLRFSSES